MGSHRKALKIKLTAPPVDGAANKQCIEILAKALNLPKSALAIIGGQTSRLKQICIQTEELRMSADGIEILKTEINKLASKNR